MTPAHLRMARAALQLTVRDVEELTGVNKNTVSRYEAGRDILASALQKLEKLYRDEGIIFLNEDARGPGVIFANTPLRRTRAALKIAFKAKSDKRSQKAK